MHTHHRSGVFPSYHSHRRSPCPGRSRSSMVTGSLTRPSSPRFLFEYSRRFPSANHAVKTHVPQARYHHACMSSNLRMQLARAFGSCSTYTSTTRRACTNPAPREPLMEDRDTATICSRLRTILPHSSKPSSRDYASSSSWPTCCSSWV